MENKAMDFSTWPRNNFRVYNGQNGLKICLRNDDKFYMVKFPSKPKKGPHDFYKNDCFSEYISCHIFQSIGIETQNTLLGFYTYNGKTSLAVACEDFNKDGFQLREFASIKNSCIESSNGGYGVELKNVLEAIDEQKMIPSDQLKNHFWDMFIGDTFLGNFDRHNGNWGLLVNEDKGLVKIAPVYDCGSCLYSMMPEEKMQNVLNDQAEIDQRLFVFPNSALKINDTKINYYDFISSLSNSDCTMALKRIVPRIDMEKINKIIDDTPIISDIQKKFYKVMLKNRKERILDVSLEKALEVDKNLQGNLDFSVKHDHVHNNGHHL
jgi:hypothetical protein